MRLYLYVSISPRGTAALPEDVKSNGAPTLSSPQKHLVKAPPSHPNRSRAPTCNASPPETNPFARRSTEYTTPISQNSPCADSDGLTTIGPRHGGQKISHNPFLMRDRLEDADSSEKPREKNVAIKSGKAIPPLPPRKPTMSASLQRPSEATTTPAPTAPCSPPLVPSKPNHVTSPLMRQSLEASKHGKTMKRAEEQLERERVLQVLKSTTSRTRSLSPSKRGCEAQGIDNNAAPAPLRRRPPSSASSSTSSSLPSLDRVASASVRPLHPSSSTVPPPLPSREAPGAIPAPPLHPDRRPSTDANDSPQSSPSSRVFRSRSMHYATDARPLPPPRRKRPESVQLTTTATASDISSPFASSSPPSHARNASLSHRPSLTRRREDASPMSNIQKTISDLQLKAQPKLDAVRYKAEAGISRRGYVSHAHIGPGAKWRDEGEEGLMEDSRWATATVDQDAYTDPVTDDEPGLWDGRDDRVYRGRPRAEFVADNLKWPAGEGWTQL